jgi:hypothetical protein
MAHGGSCQNPRDGGSAEGALHDEDTPGRLVSKKTGEWMYVFKPSVGAVVVYVKVVLRSDCVVISFHEEEDHSDEDD